METLDPDLYLYRTVYPMKYPQDSSRFFTVIFMVLHQVTYLPITFLVAFRLLFQSYYWLSAREVTRKIRGKIVREQLETDSTKPEVPHIILEWYWMLACNDSNANHFFYSRWLYVCSFSDHNFLLYPRNVIPRTMHHSPGSLLYGHLPLCSLWQRHPPICTDIRFCLILQCDTLSQHNHFVRGHSDIHRILC